MLYQVNSRVLLNSLGKNATFDDITEEWLDGIATSGFNWIYFLGIWTTGEAGIEFSRIKMQNEGNTNQTICSSPFAITEYTVHSDFGGNDAFRRLKTKCELKNLKVLVDFVPNHMAIDHPWTLERPDFLLQGNEANLVENPKNYFKVGETVFAHGRDPFYPGWKDTVQINYFNADAQAAMIDILMNIASIADGVRCDMAMLPLADVFVRTWGSSGHNTCPQFWKEAISSIRQKYAAFVFMAEVYWDREYDLQQLGFDFTYDKTLYDRLVHNNGLGVVGHLYAAPSFQEKSVRFLENHDEPRAAPTFGGIERHYAAATICYTVPGMKFFHHGQFEGKNQFISMHVGSDIEQHNDGQVTGLYIRLLRLLNRPEFKYGQCIRASVAPSLDGNESFQNIVAHFVEHKQHLTLVVVNYSCQFSDGHVHFSQELDRRWHFAAKTILLSDLWTMDTFERCGTQLVGPGMWFRLHPFQVHVLHVLPLTDVSMKKFNLVL